MKSFTCLKNVIQKVRSVLRGVDDVDPEAVACRRGRKYPPVQCLGERPEITPVTGDPNFRVEVVCCVQERINHESLITRIRWGVHASVVSQDTSKKIVCCAPANVSGVIPAGIDDQYVSRIKRHSNDSSIWKQSRCDVLTSV